jgi:hypothetical protein
MLERFKSPFAWLLLSSFDAWINEREKACPQRLLACLSLWPIEQ